MAWFSCLNKGIKRYLWRTQPPPQPPAILLERHDSHTQLETAGCLQHPGHLSQQTAPVSSIPLTLHDTAPHQRSVPMSFWDASKTQGLYIIKHMQKNGNKKTRWNRDEINTIKKYLFYLFTVQNKNFHPIPRWIVLRSVWSTGTPCWTQLP